MQSGDVSSDLDYISTTALALNGGTIKDAAGNNATLTLASPGTANSLAYQADIVVTIATKQELVTPFNSISLYPNPAKEGFYINAGETETQVSILNISGTRLILQPIQGKTYIDISSLSNGTYIVKVGNEVQKLIKQ